MMLLREEDRPSMIERAEHPRQRPRANSRPARAVLLTAGLLAASCATALRPPVETGKRAPELVEIRALDPGIHLDIRYATANNFLGRPVYREGRAFLRPEVAQALRGAHAALQAKGYGLLVFDAYRPLSVTRLFWNELPGDKRRFVANPKKGSNHNRGCAVDVSLYDLASEHEVEMPSPYDEMSERASPTYAGGPKEARARRDLLRSALEASGFRVNRGEWWHFDHRDCASYEVLDLSFEALDASTPP
jgi:D-alanyl-D-alanine dipeptidase